MYPRPPGSTLFPYTTLFRSDQQRDGHVGEDHDVAQRQQGQALAELEALVAPHHHQLERAVDQRLVAGGNRRRTTGLARDRKSTRLNSSHQIISYAVFCLKKK